eukprot:532104-Amphidinium_carterae.1
MDDYAKSMAPLKEGDKSVAFSHKQLITGEQLERSTTRRDLLEGVRNLAGKLGNRLDKNDVPILATTGI